MADGEGATRWLDEALARGGAQGAVLVALARFDLVNAAYGRRIGDLLLDAAARRVGEAAGVGRAGRVAGSEFLLLAPADSVGDAADALAAAFARPFTIEGRRIALGNRVAVVERVRERTATALLARARGGLGEGDAAVVTADARGGSEEALAVDLHHAIARGEIEMLFQPQARLADGRIVGAEALARWEHPRLGLLGADLLFAAAERAGLGSALSEHGQRLALARAAAWPAALAGLRLSVNVTAGDLAQPGFARWLVAAAGEAGFPVGRLTAEVTETGLIGDLDAGAAALAELRAAGARVALDDFGTGYSSLAYLKALPVDTIKLDRTLVSNIALAPRERVVAEGVVAIARGLGLGTVAEGVETRAQRDLLAAAGCDLYQGFLCAEALTGAALARLVG